MAEEATRTRTRDWVPLSEIGKMDYVLMRRVALRCFPGPHTPAEAEAFIDALVLMAAVVAQGYVDPPIVPTVYDV